MKTALVISVFCAVILPASTFNLCSYCDVFDKCMNSAACKYYAKKCNCEASYSSECGVINTPSRPRITTFIVGGDDAGECELPWTVAIFINGLFQCGGAIIDERHIVTAAHCFVGLKNSRDVLVGLGSSDRRQTRNHSIEAFVMHPEHDGDINDIAILRLATPISFTKCANPICLPPIDLEYKAKEQCIVAGWGLTRESYLFQPYQLQKVKVPLVEWSTCNTVYNMVETQLCAGYFNRGGKDACKTDSGGPLICNYDNKWVLTGVVSSGIGCARPRYPGKYTSVSKYVEWIEIVTGKKHS